MSLRHDDDLPPLTPAQQAEAIRLAARLQAEHEARASSEALLRAAEEAGIERRFLEDAVRQVRSTEPMPTHRDPYAGLYKVVLAGIFVASVRWPFLMVPLLAGLLVALPPCSTGRSRWATTLLVFEAFLLADLAFVVYWLLEGGASGANWGTSISAFFAVVCLEAVLSVAAVEVAREAYRLQARLVKRRPQS